VSPRRKWRCLSRDQSARAGPCWADPAPVIHYAPAENLEHIDVALIDTAKREIDMAKKMVKSARPRPVPTPPSHQTGLAVYAHN
jgi:hypothetical protein